MNTSIHSVEDRLQLERDMQYHESEIQTWQEALGRIDADIVVQRSELQSESCMHALGEIGHEYP